MVTSDDEVANVRSMGSNKLDGGGKPVSETAEARTMDADRSSVAHCPISKRYVCLELGCLTIPTVRGTVSEHKFFECPRQQMRLVAMRRRHISLCQRYETRPGVQMQTSCQVAPDCWRCRQGSKPSIQSRFPPCE